MQEELRKSQEELEKAKAEAEGLKLQVVSLEEANKLKSKKVKDIKLKEKPVFKTGTAKLTAEGKKTLKQVVEELKNYPNERLLIEGHTDSVGKESFNQKLSEDRAFAIANSLRNDYGIKNRISVSGKGEKEPIADNNTKAGRLKNRRLEFTIISAEVKEENAK